MSGAIEQWQAGEGNGVDGNRSMAGVGRVAGEICCGLKQFTLDLGVMKRKERSSEMSSTQVSIGRMRVGGLGVAGMGVIAHGLCNYISLV